MTVYVFQFCFCASFFLLLLLHHHRLLSFRFESKLVSHLARGFDPFKPLSINTNAIESSAASAAAPGNAIMKKPSVLYDSLHHHPLHQMQVQQQQQQHPQQHAYHQQHQQHQQQQLTTTAPKMTVPTAATAAATTTITSLTTPTTNLSSTATTTSVVDGQRYSRMEIYKASVANTTIDHPSNNSNSKSPHTCL